MKLTFLGAAGTVTGSKYLLETETKKTLVDCGLYQGYKELRLRNWSQLPISPKNIDAVVLTHAHIDHTGYIPLLVKNGFKGNIYCTPGTKALCEILLPDSGFLQEEEALFMNKHNLSKHKPALPLYTKEDAVYALKQFKSIDFDISTLLYDDLYFTFKKAGHIIGSAFISFTHQKTSLFFTGDMGRPHDPIMREPDVIQHTDYLVIESTYGDRVHGNENPLDQLEKIINTTIKRGGSIIIPAFAVGRAQNLLYYIDQLKTAKKIPDMPVFLDSPMAVNATRIFCDYPKEHRLTDQLCEKFCRAATYINTAEESKKLSQLTQPSIIISASGMASGGRVVHHLKTFAPDPRNTILFTGYQAGGTRGAKIIAGEKEIKIHGELVPVNAQVEMLSNASAHADYQEILEWLSNFSYAPKKIFITHGEQAAAVSLKTKIAEKFGWENCIVPVYLQKENL